MLENIAGSSQYQYLWFPLIVAVITVVTTAGFSYLVTYCLNKKSVENDKMAKTIDLIDKLLLEINKLNQIIEKLKDDVETLKYFSLKNIQVANNIGWKLRSFMDSVTLLTGELRRAIVSTIDSATFWIDEVDALERFPVSEYVDLKNKKLQTDKEYRDLSLELLKSGIFVDEIGNGKFEVRYISQEGKNLINDKTLKTAEMIRQDLIRVIDENRLRLDSINNDTTSKRNFLLLRLYSIQSSLSDIAELLSNKRIELSNK